MPQLSSRSLLTAALITALCGCASNGDNSERAQAFTADHLQLSNESAPWPAEQWWSTFGDAQLARLIEQAQSGNTSLHIAEARIRAAQQFARSTHAVNQPALSLNADANRQRFSENDIYPPPLGGSTQNHASLTLDFSYEFDFWGRQRAVLEAALTEVDAARAERSATEMLLSVAVAQTYFSQRHAQIESILAQQAVRQRQALVELMRTRVQRGLSTGIELERTIAAAAGAEQDVSAALQRVDSDTHQLALLCGVAPDQLPPLSPPPGDIAGALFDTTGDATLPQSIPADLLGRRADIVAQSLRVRAEAKQIDAAKAEFYPNIDLTAFFGLESIGFSHLFETESRAWGVGPALHLPLFNRETLRAQLGARNASYDIAVEQYNASVLTAVRETADAGSALRSSTAQRRSVDTARQAVQRARDAAQLRYQRGLGDRAELINADIALLNQQRALNAASDAQTQAQLALIKALGGGFDAAPTARH